jgi:hypothetical protein
MKMNEDLRHHWEALLNPLFSAGSEIEIDSNAPDFRLRASWKLGTDPNRPNKMSKIIIVLVPAEVADDYSNKNDAQQKSDDEKLLRFVRDSLSNHDPDRNMSR